MVWAVICQSLCLCQGPVLFTSTEVADKNSNAEHSSVGKMTNTQGMEMEIIKKQSSEGLREVRVTWWAWIMKHKEIVALAALNL